MQKFPTDAQCAAAVGAYHQNNIQGFHYAPWYVIRDLSLRPGEQEIWRGPDNDSESFERRIRIEKMRRALIAAEELEY